LPHNATIETYKFDKENIKKVLLVENFWN